MDLVSFVSNLSDTCSYYTVTHLTFPLPLISRWFFTNGPQSNYLYIISVKYSMSQKNRTAIRLI